MSDVIRNITLASILVAVVAVLGFLAGLWGAVAVYSIGNLGWGLWLAAGYMYLKTEADVT